MTARERVSHTRELLEMAKKNSFVELWIAAAGCAENLCDDLDRAYTEIERLGGTVPEISLEEWEKKWMNSPPRESKAEGEKGI